MALDPEELRKKRAEREHLRKVQKLRKRKLLIRLAVAAAVLIACGVLIFVFSGSPDENPSAPQTTLPETSPALQTEQPETAAQPEQPKQSQPEQTLPPATTIHLVFGGDLNVTDGTVAAGGAEYVYKDAFQDVAAVLADADVTALNLEGNLRGEPYGTESKSAPQGMMEALDKAGVDMIQLANSYSIFSGTSGLFSTIDAVHAAGMEPLGVSQDAAQPPKGYTIVDVQGIKIAFVAFTKGMDGMTLPEGSKNCVNLLYKDYDSTYQSVDTEGITQVLGAIEKENPDLTVAMLHWGSEFNDTISKSQEKIVKLMHGNGVDAIIGSHSHYVQKVTYDRALGRLVAYSLGDFFGDASRSGSEYSVLLDVEVTRDNTTGETTITGFNYTPIFTVTEPEKPARVVRIREAIAAYEGGYLEKVSEETYNAMKFALERIDKRILDSDS